MRSSEQKERLLGKIADIFELPKDVILDLPRLIMTGNERLLIENHRGILVYSEENVRIKAAKGEIRITGRDLTLLEITKEEIWLEGRIEEIKLPEWRE